MLIALTTRTRLQRLAKLYRAGGARQHGEVLEEPWGNFRQTIIDKVKAINVSHRVQRKVAGALHEETYYGKGNRDSEWIVRKPIESLSANEFERIRDPFVRRLVLNRLHESGIKVGRGKKVDPNGIREALADIAMPSGVPIKKVRVLKPEQTVRPLRKSSHDNPFVKPGSTHHLCIFEFFEQGKVKREAIFVTTLEAIQRIQRNEQVICRTHPTRPNANFVMSLSSRELVLANWKGRQRVLVFKTAASTQGQIYFADQYDARRSGDQAKYVATANSLDARKITVDLLGRIRWAND